MYIIPLYIHISVVYVYIYIYIYIYIYNTSLRPVGGPPTTPTLARERGESKSEQDPTRQWRREKGVLEPSGGALRSESKGSNMQGAS